MNLVPNPDSNRGRFAFLAPPQATVPSHFTRVESDLEWHQRVLRRVQCLRGKVYLDEGAIQASQLSEGGAHELPVDELAWHVLALDETMRLYGCSRYLAHSNRISFPELSLRGSALTKSREWGSKFRDAVESEIDFARNRNIAFVEVGGWALMPELRGTAEALRIALATYSLARALGGCIGTATATHRHGSSSILRRLGGRPLKSKGVEIPPYFDPQYGCDMEVLRFDSCEPNRRFEIWIDELCDFMRTEPVIHHDYPATVPAQPEISVPEFVGFGPRLAAAV